MFTGQFSLASSDVAFNAAIATDGSSFSGEPVNTFSTRHVTIYTHDNTILVPVGTTTPYINWPFPVADTLLINIPLLRDYALRIVVDWISLSPQSGSTYQATQYVALEAYNNNNEYGLINAMTGRPIIVQDRDYLINMGRVRTNIVNSGDAIYFLQQKSSQAAINRAEYLLNNQLTFF